MNHKSWMFCLLMLGCALLLVFRPARAAGIDGDWTFTFHTDDGERQAPASFKVDGDQVTGKFANSTEVHGTFREGKLELNFHFVYEEGGLEGDLKMSGTLEGDHLSGDWDFAGYSGKFEAKRPE